MSGNFNDMFNMKLKKIIQRRRCVEILNKELNDER